MRSQVPLSLDSRVPQVSSHRQASCPFRDFSPFLCDAATESQVAVQRATQPLHSSSFRLHLQCSQFWQFIQLSPPKCLYGHGVHDIQVDVIMKCRLWVFFFFELHWQILFPSPLSACASCQGENWILSSQKHVFRVPSGLAASSILPSPGVQLAHSIPRWGVLPSFPPWPMQ